MSGIRSLAHPVRLQWAAGGIAVVLLALNYGPRQALAQDEMPMGKAAWSHVSEHRIVIGTASAFHRFNNYGLEQYYNESYVPTAREAHPDAEASMSMDEFGSRFAGWVKLKFGVGTSVIGGHYQPALIPVALKEQIEYSSSVGAILGNQSGDLVAATNNIDGSFVIDTILCKDDPSFHICARKYERGYFDADKGYQLTLKFTPMVPGRKIDVNTYEIMD